MPFKRASRQPKPSLARSPSLDAICSILRASIFIPAERARPISPPSVKRHDTLHASWATLVCYVRPRLRICVLQEKWMVVSMMCTARGIFSRTFITPHRARCRLSVVVFARCARRLDCCASRTVVRVSAREMSSLLVYPLLLLVCRVVLARSREERTMISSGVVDVTY